MVELEIGEREFNVFRELIYREAGIKLSDQKKALVQARVSRRCRILKINTYRAYHNYLLENYEQEIIEFINTITTNKTEFFREKQHFLYMQNVVLPEFCQSGKKDLRIWSAGCSTGEEAYTVALTVLDYFKEKRLPDFKVLATDIDTHVLSTAMEGVYKREVIQNISIPLLKEFFFRGRGENEGKFKVKDQLKRYIFFRRLNLMEETYPMKGRFDCVFCRNVIIYFDKKDQVKLFNKIHRYMVPGGFLFLGHSENISTICDGFQLVGNTVYRRVDKRG